MSKIKTVVKFETKKVSLKDLTPEQRIFVVNKANETGKPLEEIIQEVKEG